MTAYLLFLAALLVIVAGLLAGAEAAVSRVSRVAADELVKEGRRGAQRLQQVLEDPARYLNLLTLLRVTAELVATVLVTVAALETFDITWQAVLVASASMVLVSYIASGVSPRTLGRQHPAPTTRTRSPACSAMSSSARRWPRSRPLRPGTRPPRSSTC